MLVLDWGMNVYKMVKFTPVDRRLFVSCVDFLFNYVARKLSFNYEILQKKKLQQIQAKESIVARVVARGAFAVYNTSQRKLRSSSQHLLVTPKARVKTYGERVFAVAAPTLWNSIPLELRSSSSIDILIRLTF